MIDDNNDNNIDEGATKDTDANVETSENQQGAGIKQIDRDKIYDSKTVDPRIEPTPKIFQKKKGGKITGVIARFAVFALVIFGAYYYFFIQEKGSMFYRAEMSYIEGQIERSETDGVWIELKISDEVRQGDIVRVNGEGRAIISLDDGSAIRLSDNSRVRLVSLNPNNIQITNEAGEIYNRVVKADRPFIVKVDDETYQSLGTAYKTINKEGEKGVYVYESAVKVASLDVEVAEGQKLFQENLADASLVGKVTAISTEELSADDFIQWNRQEDLKDDDFKNKMGVLETVVANNTNNQQATETEQEVETKNEGQTQQNNQPVQNVPVGSIRLTAEATSTGISFSWTTENVDISKGFKLVKSQVANPVYPGDSATYLNAEARSYFASLTDGKTYNFRVCQYLGGSCGVYSNNVQVTAPVAVSVVNSIVLSGDGNKVTWTLDGYSSMGFKLVWSKTSAPTYPTRESDKYNYFSSPETRSGTLEAFDGAGEYYVRVCEYLGGACGKYSNEIVVTLSEES